MLERQVQHDMLCILGDARPEGRAAVTVRADCARLLPLHDSTLREGKRLLKEKSGAAAMVRFEKALMLSKANGDKLAQRRAYRGLAAAERLQGQSKAAIKHLLVVLKLSNGEPRRVTQRPLALRNTSR